MGSTVSTAHRLAPAPALHNTAFDEKGVVVLCNLLSKFLSFRAQARILCATCPPSCHSEEDGTSDVRISFFVETNGAPARETPTSPAAPRRDSSARRDSYGRACALPQSDSPSTSPPCRPLSEPGNTAGRDPPDRNPARRPCAPPTPSYTWAWSVLAGG